MALSRSEYKKKYGETIEQIKKENKKKKQQVSTNTKNNNLNNTASSLKRDYLLAKEENDKNKTQLKNYLASSGVVTSNKNSYSAPDLFTVRNQQLKDSLSGKRSLLENDAQTVINLPKIEQSNVEKYQNAIKTTTGKNLMSAVRESENKEAFAESAYKSQKAVEDWENANKIERVGKIISSPIRGAMEVLNLTNNRVVQNEDGSSYTLPSYLESLDSKINESAGTVGKIVNSVGGQVGKRLAASALNKVLPGVGTVMYNVDIFENQYNSAMRQGYNQNQATAYATLGTATEFATQKILGASTGLFKGQGDFEKSIDKILQNVIKSDAKNKVVSSMVSEGIEEFLQEYIDIFNRNLTLDEDNEYFTTENLENAVYSALIGALSGGLGETQTQIRLGSVNRQANQIIYDIEKANNTELSNINKTKISNIVHCYYLNNDQLVDPKSVVQSYMDEKRTKIDTLKDSAANSGLDINNTKTVNMLNTLTKLIEDRDYDITFDSSIGNRVNGVLIDGQTIKINPNSENAIETIAMHEVTHSISTDTMRELVEDYAKKHPDYKKYIDSKKKDYNTTELIDELLADVSGQLFGNQEYINMLSNEEPSTFRKVYNAVISVANKLTGNSNTFLFTQDLKNKWENAYRNQNNNLSNEVKYSTIGLKGAKNLTKNSNSRYYKNLLNNQKYAREIFNNNNDLETNNIKSKQETGWFKTKFGDWATIISDKDSEVVATLEPNKSYKLGNILKHDLLYDAYPELKKLKVITSDINMAGGYATFSFLPANTITDEIYIRNSDINKKDFRKVLLHEINHYIQHKENYDKQSRGSNSSVDGKESYRNNLGEIISNETKINADLTQNDLDAIILPEQAKSNPKYENIKDNLLKSNRNDLKDGEGKNALQNMELSVQNKIKIDKMGDKEDNKNSRIISDIEELDNSSFSLKEQGANNFIKDNFKASGTRTYSKDIKVPKSTRKTVLPKSQSVPLPTNSNMQNSQNKTSNPVEISNLKLEDASTTPTLPKSKKSNQKYDGESHFYNNIQNKTNMLNQAQKDVILDDDEVRYYDKITNQESLEKAFKRLNEGGATETTKWFNKKDDNADATDVAEGWILMKQYADEGNLDMMVEVAKKMRNIGTKGGQLVEAFKIMERMTPEGMVKYAQSELSEAYDNMIKNKSETWINKHREDFDLRPNEVQFIIYTMKEVTAMEDGYDKRVKLAEIQKLMTDKLPPEKGAGIKSWMRISMLFNPKTQVRNVMGNAVITPVNYFSDMFSSVVDRQIAKKTGVRTTGMTNIKESAKGFGKGIYQSYNDFKKGINTRNIDGNRFEIGEGKAFNNNNILGKGLNKVDNLLSFMLDAGDRGFYEAAFTNSINNQLVLNNTKEVTQDMIDIATQEALSRTWQDNNNYTKFVLNIRKGLNQIGIGQYGLGDILIPFAKTPANLTKAIVDYSPAGLVKTIIDGNNLRKSLTNGQYTPQMQHKFVQDLGKATAGTMLYVLGYALAEAGISTGASDEDKDVSNFLKNTLGINSYSIKIGDKSFTYDWAQPIAAPLSITANIVNSKNKEAALAEGIVNSLDTAGSILLEQSFLQSLNDVLNSNDGVVSGLTRELLELPARAVPTLSKQITDLIDGTQRTTFEYGKPLKSAINAVTAKLPGLSQTLEPSVDTMGREIQKYGGKNNPFNVFLNPANINTENISDSATEIYRLYQKTGDATIMPRVAPYYINQNGEKITLTSKERTEYQKKSGQIIEENIEKLLDNEDYIYLSDIEKADIINNIVNYSYNIANKEVIGSEITSTYETAYQYSKVGDISDYYIMKSQEFTSDKDEDGNTISGSKKKKVVDFINSLDISVENKLILIKLNGYALNYNENLQVVRYIVNQDISESEMEELLLKLDYTVKNGKVYW